MCSYAEFLVAADRLDAAGDVVGEVEHRLATGEEWIAAVWLPLARAALARARGDDAAAERVLRAGIELQESCGALGPQLRTATALADLLCDGGRSDEATAVLEPVLERFGEGADTADVVEAHSVLHRATSRRDRGAVRRRG
jgi:hypothetical protein